PRYGLRGGPRPAPPRASRRAPPSRLFLRLPPRGLPGLEPPPLPRRVRPRRRPTGRRPRAIRSEGRARRPSMAVKRVSPEEARDLMHQDGYVYVDVRSVPEFEAGHPIGAYNVPLMHPGPQGMVPNPDFMSVMQQSFAKDRKIVVGCQAGGRSLRAANE